MQKRVRKRNRRMILAMAGDTSAEVGSDCDHGTHCMGDYNNLAETHASVTCETKAVKLN
jgi:hypothetical protein